MTDDNINVDYINAVLEAVSLSTISSSDADSLTPEAEDIISQLRRRSKYILAQGWKENKFYLHLTQDSEGRVAIPDNFLRVKPYDDDRRVIQRYVVKDFDGKGKYLYDLIDQSYTIPFAPTIYEVTIELSLDEMSVELREYIIAHTARLYQEQSLESVSSDGFLLRHEGEQLARLNEAQFDVEDINVLTDNEQTRDIIYRRRPAFYYGV